MKSEIPSRLIAIAGGSGAGKSWLAGRLQRALGTKAARLSLDDFYRDRSHLPPGRREQINYDHPRAIDWPCLERVLGDCRAGRRARVPCYDFATHTRSSRRRQWQPRALILVEGLWLLHRRAVRGQFDLKIYVGCPENIRMGRRLARDVAERGRNLASVRRQFREKVAPMHQRFVAPQALLADIVLTRPPGRGQVRQLAAILRTLANERTPTYA
jgi:uridine kinase